VTDPGLQLDQSEPIARVARLAVEHRVGVIAVTVIAAIAAIGVGAKLRFDALPDVTGTQVLVLTGAPGLTPEEVERQVTRTVELALGGRARHSSTHRSISRYGISSVTAVFERDSVDPYRARQLVGERLAGVTGCCRRRPSRPSSGPMSGGLGEIFQFVVRSTSRSAVGAARDREPRDRAHAAVGAGRGRGEPVGRRAPHARGGGRSRAHVGARRDALGSARRSVERALGTAPGASLPAGASHVLLRGRLAAGVARGSRRRRSAARLPWAEGTAHDGASWARLSDVARDRGGRAAAHRRRHLERRRRGRLRDVPDAQRRERARGDGSHPRGAARACARACPRTSRSRSPTTVRSSSSRRCAPSARASSRAACSSRSCCSRCSAACARAASSPR
jgi:hypothetical protein